MSNQSVSFEVFAARDSRGRTVAVTAAVPCRCGLRQADALHVRGLAIHAECDGQPVNVRLADLSEQSRKNLWLLHKAGVRLAIAEMSVRGLVDSYFVKVVFDQVQ